MTRSWISTYTADIAQSYSCLICCHVIISVRTFIYLFVKIQACEKNYSSYIKYMIMKVQNHIQVKGKMCFFIIIKVY